MLKQDANKKRLIRQMKRFGVQPQVLMGDRRPVFMQLVDGEWNDDIYQRFLIRESLDALEAIDIDGMDKEEKERAFWDALVPVGDLLY